MKLKFNVKRELKIFAAIVVVVAVIAFTEGKQSDVAIKDITIKIENQHGNHYLDEADIMELMMLDQQNIRGAKLERINLRDIEKKIRKDPFIKSAEMYSDLKGNMVVKVEMRRPIARIVRNDGPDGYIAEDGTVMPVSEKFTSRVTLISGAHVRALLRQRNLSESKEGRALLKLLMIIREDDFWNAQIAQLDIDDKGRIAMYPQVGNERIEFGKPAEPEVKLKKLKIFYKEILPRVGWNKYERVNLEYEGQIIAE